MDKEIKEMETVKNRMTLYGIDYTYDNSTGPSDELIQQVRDKFNEGDNYKEWLEQELNDMVWKANGDYKMYETFKNIFSHCIFHENMNYEEMVKQIEYEWLHSYMY